MLSDKLNITINKQVAESTTFWAGKPKLNESEVQAVADFAKKKGDALDRALSYSGIDLNALTQEAIDKATKK